jgi:hypothetical protein
MFRKMGVVWGMLAVFLTADVLLLLSVLTAPPAPLSLDRLLPTAEYLEQNPQPTPDFIAKYSIISTQVNSDNKQLVHVSLREEPFARVALSADDLTKHLLSAYRLDVDNTPMSVYYAIQTQPLICEGLSRDISQDRCWGGDIELYFDVSDLDVGLHLAEITVTDLEGVPHSFSWAFRID